MAGTTTKYGTKMGEHIALHRCPATKCFRCQALHRLQWLEWDYRPLTPPLCLECFIDVSEQVLTDLETGNKETVDRKRLK